MKDGKGIGLPVGASEVKDRTSEDFRAPRRWIPFGQEGLARLHRTASLQGSVRFGLSRLEEHLSHTTSYTQGPEGKTCERM